MSKKWYAGHNDYGKNCTYDSEGWQVFWFDTKAERDEYVSNNGRNAEAISRRTAEQILGGLGKNEILIDDGYNNGPIRRVAKEYLG